MHRRALNRIDDTVDDVRQLESRVLALSEQLRLCALQVRELQHSVDELLSDRDGVHGL